MRKGDKKNFKNSDFSAQLPSVLIENRRNSYLF